ncbi:MAG: penicillin-binding protein 4 [Chitinivibrionales bacterium]|nr:penicillin-binding protein 4 [Chitinivibrionales bacterium]
MRVASRNPSHRLDTVAAGMPRSLLIMALLIMLPDISVYAGTGLSAQIAGNISNGSVVLHDETGNELFAHNAEKLYVPASIIKILTAHIALDVLGKEYRFKTEFYTNAAGDLAIKGFGDPYLISEEIKLIADSLRARQIRQIGQVFLDHSYFETNLTIPGVSRSNNPYDALNGSLVVNFNTINIRKDAQGKVYSAEKETPLTPLAIGKARRIANGRKQRINLSADPEDCHQYCGELFLEIFRQAGISHSNTLIGKAKADTNWKLVYTHRNSRKLPEVLRGLLKYSNNFIANQIFLTVGAHRKGPAATHAKAKAVFEDYIQHNMHIAGNQLTLVEGSGISRSNKTTARVMMYILEQFRDHADLLTPKNGHPVKSGTLSGVNNYAGYIKTGKGLRPFVIMLNQPAARRDRIMRLLGKL